MSARPQPITFGCDPEFFLMEAATREPHPVVGLLGGTKDKPRIVDGYGLQEDNVMCEFTCPVSTSPREMYTFAQEGVRTLLGSLRTARTFAILPSPFARFRRAMLETLGPQAFLFGCSPDFDGYNNGEVFPRVAPEILDDADGHSIRFAGGHIHIGYKATRQMPEYVAALFCDVTIGLSLITGGERQGRRRGMYGMAGRHRPTSYGVEYRTPCNMWLYERRVAQSLLAGCDNLRALFALPDRRLVEAYNEVPWTAVQNAINTEDRGQAQQLIEWFNYNILDGEG